MGASFNKNPLVFLSALFVILFTLLFVKINIPKAFEQNILPKDRTGNIDAGNKIGLWHGTEVTLPSDILNIDNGKVLSLVPKNERWIEVDLSEQKLKAWENNELFLESLVSTGLPWWPTPQGEFTIWLKLRASTMEGGEGKYYYNLPNVPYVMFFQNDQVAASRGFGLHGTYWHDDFGRVHSHGCVNLPTSVAKELYYWTYPILSNNQKQVYASEENPGTRIVIHE